MLGPEDEEGDRRPRCREAARQLKIGIKRDERRQALRRQRDHGRRRSGRDGGARRRRSRTAWPRTSGNASSEPTGRARGIHASVPGRRSRSRGSAAEFSGSYRGLGDDARLRRAGTRRRSTSLGRSSARPARPRPAGDARTAGATRSWSASSRTTRIPTSSAAFASSIPALDDEQRGRLGPDRLASAPARTAAS